MPALFALTLLAHAPAVDAAQLEWRGHYRARGLIYDSLSLSDTNPQAEGTRHLLDHRLRLEPRWLLSDRVGIYAQVDALDLVPWGVEPEGMVDPVTGEETALAFEQTLVAPTNDDGGLLRSSIAVTRAWAEVYSDIGRFRFGRVPLHWGTGIFLNDGLSPNAEYGDTADRVQFTTRLGLVYLMAAWDLNYEGLLNENDDMATANLAVAYQTETVGLGYYNWYRYQPSQSFGSYAGDLWFHAILGPAEVDAEVVGLFGGGNLEGGANDVRISAFGAMVRAGLNLESLSLGIEGGLATGDADPDDATIRTFSFDRDHNVALMLFEEPLPTLAAVTTTEANEGEYLDAALTGEGVRNALYIRPHVGWQFLPNLKGDLALVAAQAAKLPEEYEESRGYGLEVDATLIYEPYEHLSVRGTLGVLFPGEYYRAFEDEGEVFTGFDRPAVGGLLMGTVAF